MWIVDWCTFGPLRCCCTYTAGWRMSKADGIETTNESRLDADGYAIV